MGIILNSTGKKTRDFNNPIDLSACSSGECAHKNYAHIANIALVMQNNHLSEFYLGKILYNIANTSTLPSNYIRKTPEFNGHLE